MAQEDAARYQSIKPPVAQAVKAEKMSAPVSEEQRKQNQQIFAKMSGIPSIAGLKQKEQELNESDAAQKATLQRNTPFDAPAFNKAWESVCAKVKEQDKDSLLVCLTKHPHEVDFATYVVKITIDNKTQEQILNREKPWLLEDLRDLLQNDQITFDVGLTENSNTAKPYTQREKFMKMAEKNPALIYLAEKLKLEL